MKKMILFFVFASFSPRSGLLAQQQETPVLQIIAQSQDAMEQQDFARASSLIQNALARHPESEGLQLQQARLYTYQKRDRQAIDLVNVLLRKNPASRDARLTLAQIYGYRRNDQNQTPFTADSSVDPADEAAALGLIDNLVLEDSFDAAMNSGRRSSCILTACACSSSTDEYLVQADAAPESTPERVPRIRREKASFPTIPATGVSLHPRACLTTWGEASRRASAWTKPRYGRQPLSRRTFFPEQRTCGSASASILPCTHPVVVFALRTQPASPFIGRCGV